MRKIDVTEAIDNNSFGAFQWAVVALCALLLIFAVANARSTETGRLATI